MPLEASIASLRLAPYPGKCSAMKLQRRRPIPNVTNCQSPLHWNVI